MLSLLGPNCMRIALVVASAACAAAAASEMEVGEERGGGVTHSSECKAPVGVNQTTVSIRMINHLLDEHVFISIMKCNCKLMMLM